MRNNKKKGFTLVELLVVIAILAILATVSVVTYTSYIESTQVRVDSDLAVQLNRLLEAYKVNFHEDITEDNIHEVTANLLKEGGVAELNPKSSKYGYHYYYNLETGTYELLHNDEAVDDDSVLEHLIKFVFRVSATDTPKYKETIGNCFTIENKYYLVDTAGDLADVIEGYYSFEKLDGQTTAEKFATYLTKVTNAKVDPITTLVNETVFVTKDGNYVASLTGTHNKLAFVEGATYVSNVITDGTTDVTLGGDNYLLTFTDNGYVEIPEGIQLPTNSLHISVADGKKVVVELNGSNWDALEKLADRSFTNANVTVVLNNTEYVVKDAIVNWNTDELKDNLDTTKAAALLASNFPLYDFDLVLNPVDSSVKNKYVPKADQANYGYLAVDIKDGFTFSFANVNKLANKPASTPEVEWSIVSLTIDGTPVTDVETFITQNGSVFTFNKVSYDEDTSSYVKDANGLLPKVDTIKVMATATTANGVDETTGELVYANTTYTVDVVRITNVELKLGGVAMGNSLVNLVLNNSKATDFELKETITYRNGGFITDGTIVLDEDIKLEYLCIHAEHTIECCGHVHDENCSGNFKDCPHQNCQPGDSCMDCTHICAEWENYCCTHKTHTDACRDGSSCDHISGGDHLWDSTNGVMLESSPCLTLCPHLNGTHTDACREGKCDHMTGGDHTYNMVDANGDGVTDCFVCPHQAGNHDDACYQGGACDHVSGGTHMVDADTNNDGVSDCLNCTHEDITVDGSGYNRYYACTSCPDYDNKNYEGTKHACYKKGLYGVGSAESYCNGNVTGCIHTNGHVDTCYNACVHVDEDGNKAHTDACLNVCTHATNHEDSCYVCTGHAHDENCVNVCEHATDHEDSCYSCTNKHTHTDKCVNLEKCNHVEGGAHTVGTDGSCCGHECDDDTTQYACLECTHSCLDTPEICGDCDHVHHFKADCTDANCTKDHCECRHPYDTAKANQDDTTKAWYLTGNGQCGGTATVTVGNYFKQTYNVQVYDSFETDDEENLKVLGSIAADRACKYDTDEDGNPKEDEDGNLIVLEWYTTNTIKVEDLFKGDIPTDATVLIFGSNDDDAANNYMTPTRTLLVSADDKAEVEALGKEVTLWVNDNVITYVNGAWEEIQFYGTRPETVWIAVVVDVEFDEYGAVTKVGKRISEDVEVEIAVATNVRDYNELDRNGGSNVLLADIRIPDTTDATKTLEIKKDTTFYGNGFTFDIRHGALKGVTGIIDVYGTLRDTRIIGSIYETLELSGNNNYGTNAVRANAGAVIDNCYIANTRAPLVVGTENKAGTVIVRNTVLFGGRYGNVDFRGGTLQLENTVIMINQPYDGVVGTGINVFVKSASGSDTGAPVLNITEGCTFKQYNFVAENAADLLPNVKFSYSDLDFDINVSNFFKLIFGNCIKDHKHDGTEGMCCNNCEYGHDHSWDLKCGLDTDKYSQFVFEHNGTRYANMALLSMNGAQVQFTNGVPAGQEQTSFTYVDLIIQYNMFVTSPANDYKVVGGYHVDANGDGFCDNEQCLVAAEHRHANEEGEDNLCDNCNVEITDANKDGWCGTLPYTLHADSDDEDTKCDTCGEEITDENKDAICTTVYDDHTLTDGVCTVDKCDNATGNCVCYYNYPNHELLAESMNAQYTYCFENWTDADGVLHGAYDFVDGEIIH